MPEWAFSDGIIEIGAAACLRLHKAKLQKQFR